MAMNFLQLQLACAVLTVVGSTTTRPNLILVMCDDLDKLLGGETAIPQVKKLLGAGGADAANYFVSSPKCTPSRSAWLSGRHYHNLRPFGATTGTGLNTSNFFDHDAVFPSLRRANYVTAVFGKIHNNQAGWLCSRSNNHTEPFDHIETECKPCGGYYRLGPQDWVAKGAHTDEPHLFGLTSDNRSDLLWSNYSEAQYGNRTIRWIKKVVTAGTQPFFAFVGTSGPHLGVVPAPWHRARTWDQTGKAPRTPNFNLQATDHHPLLATAPILDDDGVASVDQIFRDRWGTLFSIDDTVAGIHTAVVDLGIADNTYMIFTSDHGYHLGQFRMPDEKMMPYETDVRVPFYIMGPGIAPGTVIDEMISNIDIGPTLLELAGATPPNIMDGRSLVPLITGQTEKLSRPWRTHFMIEFAEGDFQEWGTNGYWTYDPTNPGTDITSQPPYGPGCKTHAECCGGKLDQFGKNITSGPCAKNACAVSQQCPKDVRVDYQYDDPTYNWRALRVINTTHNFTFVQFDPDYLFDEAPDNPNHTITPHKLMRGVNIVGQDDPSPCPPAVNGDDWKSCESACLNKSECVGWTLHENGATNPAPGWRCCTKTTIEKLVSAIQFTTSGVINASSAHQKGTTSSPMSTITFTEFYDLNKDPWQMTNLWATLSAEVQQSLKSEITQRFACKGTRDRPSSCE